MKISVKNSISSTDLVIILVPEKGVAKAYGKTLGSAVIKEIERVMKDTDFHKTCGQAMLLNTSIKGVKRVVAIGMGEIKEPGDYRKCVSLAVRKANKLKVKEPFIVLPSEIDLERAINGAFEGNYSFKIGDQSEKQELKSLTLISDRTDDIKNEVAMGESVGITKDLVNYPPNYMTPIALAAEAQTMAKKIKGLKVTILTPKQMDKLGMGALLNVGKGSVNESRLIVVEYMGGKKSEAPLALVGKGVTFDSGGYNLKPTRYIEDMKCDMAGGATVLGLMHYFAKTKAKKNIVGVVGAVENMVSRDAYRPGDVVKAMNGKTIEIGNTDAEGRLVLADALHYTETKYKPAAIVDFATLTGACMVALGYT
ncbi:MAG TPA: M17 family peptidase N-terminal domain-containing protein, partial [Candidatus Gracilibacteria bacterium]